MTLQEQIEVVMENIDTPIANSGSLQIARQIIRKQSEALKVAKEALRPLAEVSKTIKRTNGKEEDCGIWRGQKSEFEEVRLTVSDARNAEKALATIEEMEKL